MGKLLPSSWLRVEASMPRYNQVKLLFSGHTWLPFADIPFTHDITALYADLRNSFPEGFVIRGCPPEISDLFVSLRHDTLRTGIEAVLDLSDGSHFSGQKVLAALKRGWRHGSVEEIALDKNHEKRLEPLLSASPHAAKPQLRHVFRSHLSQASRCFVFHDFSGRWLACMSLSRKGTGFYQAELMLRDRNAPGDIMECLITETSARLRAEGVAGLSLGEVPFMLHEGDSQPLNIMENLVFSAVTFCRHAYDYRGLYSFKNKFRPVWRTMRLCGGPGLKFTPLVIAELAYSMGFVELLAYSTQLLAQGWPGNPAGGAQMEEGALQASCS